MKNINERGLVMIGCGFMGKALLEGWLAQGLNPEAVFVQDPTPTDWLLAQSGLHVNETPPDMPAVLLLGVKPQVLGDVLPGLADYGGGGTLIVSIVTGAALRTYEDTFGQGTPVVRVMPNLPTAVGAGVSAYACNSDVSPDQKVVVEAMFDAVGISIQLDDESQLHAVTGISGSGPAYIFAMAEAMAQAGEAMGLPSKLAARLALNTIVGAGLMMRDTEVAPSDLRIAVTSKGGTTSEALKVLMAPDDGLFPLMEKTSQASRDRSRELGETA